MIVLAPSEEALGRLDMDSFEGEEGRADLESILSYHLLLTVLPTTRIPDGTTMVPTLNPDTPMSIAKSGTSIEVNGVANFLETERDILTHNGIVHFIDRVILDTETWQPTVSPTLFPTGTPTQSPLEPGATTPPTSTAVPPTLLPTFVPTAGATLPNETMVATESPTLQPNSGSGVNGCYLPILCVLVFVCSTLL